ncbi:MAG: START domain-containing protein, partial [Bacteroidota bacterium]
MHYSIAFALIFNFIISTVSAQNPEIISNEGWSLEKEKYGIKVYSKALTGYEVKAFKASGLIDASVDKVADIVMDIVNYTAWYPHCKVGEVLPGSNDTVQFRRVEFNLPWPFENRDTANKLEMSQSKDSTWITIYDAAKDYPKEKKVYRVEKTEGYWKIVKEGRQTRLTYAAVGEPGGIPTWIVNIFLFDSPLDAIN